MPFLHAIPRRTVSVYPGELNDILSYVVSKPLRESDYREPFAKAFADTCGLDRVLLTDSGSHGLKAILELWGVEPGSKVILPAYTDESIPNTIIEVGCIPVPVDIDLADFNMSTDNILAAVDDDTSAIIATHIFGSPFDVEGLRTRLEGRDIRIIEDCAHGVGASVNGRHVGGAGDASFFSFSATKPFHTYNGGAFWLSNWSVLETKKEILDGFEDSTSFPVKVPTNLFLRLMTFPPVFWLCLYPVLRLLQTIDLDASVLYGSSLKKVGARTPRIGLLTNFQAYIGLKRLEHHDKLLQQVRHNAMVLDKHLNPEIRRPRFSEDSSSNAYFFNILVDQPKALREELLRSGVDTGQHVMRMIPAMFNIEGSYHATEEAYHQTVQLPIHSDVTPNDIKRMAEVVNRYHEATR